MRAFLIALLLWSLVVLTWILVNPGNSSALGCMHQVGRSVACEAQQNAINQVWWDYQTLPTLATIAAGYIAIVIVRLVRLRRRRRPDLLG
jgi:glycerol uptake facilitator-like aquaporin